MNKAANYGSPNQKCVVVIDRGALDGRAYCESEEQFEEVVRRATDGKFTPDQLRDERYDQVSSDALFSDFSRTDGPCLFLFYIIFVWFTRTCIFIWELCGCCVVPILVVLSFPLGCRLLSVLYRFFCRLSCWRQRQTERESTTRWKIMKPAVKRQRRLLRYTRFTV